MNAPFDPKPVPASEVPADCRAAFDVAGWRIVIDADGDCLQYPAPQSVQAERFAASVVRLLDQRPAQVAA